MKIRPEQTADFETVRNITTNAFAESELGHNGEADLVETLREACPDALSLVAEINDVLVGHILFTPATIGEGQNEIRGMGLAPMSVLPESQGRGVGSALVRTGLERLREADVPFVIVLGHPEYYPKFGFEPASRRSVECEFPGVPEGSFMILVLREDSRIEGTARYHRAFRDA